MIIAVAGMEKGFAVSDSGARFKAGRGCSYLSGMRERALRGSFGFADHA